MSKTGRLKSKLKDGAAKIPDGAQAQPAPVVQPQVLQGVDQEILNGRFILTDLSFRDALIIMRAVSALPAPWAEINPLIAKIDSQMNAQQAAIVAHATEAKKKKEAEQTQKAKGQGRKRKA